MCTYLPVASCFEPYPTGRALRSSSPSLPEHVFAGCGKMTALQILCNTPPPWTTSPLARVTRVCLGLLSPMLEHKTGGGGLSIQDSEPCGVFPEKTGLGPEARKAPYTMLNMAVSLHFFVALRGDFLSISLRLGLLGRGIRLENGNRR